MPNPFSSSTLFRYAIDREGRVRLRLFDVAGRHVRTLVEARVAAGAGGRGWDGRDGSGRPVASGIYLVRLRAADGSSAVRRVVLAK